MTWIHLILNFILNWNVLKNIRLKLHLKHWTWLGSDTSWKDIHFSCLQIYERNSWENIFNLDDGSHSEVECVKHTTETFPNYK